MAWDSTQTGSDDITHVEWNAMVSYIKNEASQATNKIDHDSLKNYKRKYHVDWSVASSADIHIDNIYPSRPTSGIDHDAAKNFVANEHKDHTSVTLTAGTALTGGGDISANRTFNVDETAIDHDNLNNYDANEHVDHTGVSILDNTTITGGGDLSANRTLSVVTAKIDHDTLLNFAANEHYTEASIDHDNITNTHNLTTDIDHDATTNFAANEHIDWTSSGAGTIHSTNYSAATIPCDYFIYKDGSTYYAKDRDGSVASSNAACHHVMQYSIDQLHEGGKIQMSTGTFSITSPMYIRNNYLVIQGCGRKTEFNIDNYQACDCFDIVGKFCTFKDFRILEADRGIYAHKGSGFPSNNVFYSVACDYCNTGFEIEKGYYNVFIYPHADHCDNNGIMFRNLDQAGGGIVIVGGRLTNNGKDGLMVSNAHAGSITGTVFESNTSCGVNLQRVATHSLNGCYADNNGLYSYRTSCPHGAYIGNSLNSCRGKSKRAYIDSPYCGIHSCDFRSSSDTTSLELTSDATYCTLGNSYLSDGVTFPSPKPEGFVDLRYGYTTSRNALTKTGAFTATMNDIILADASGGAFSVTLPSTPTAGVVIDVKKTDSSANAVTVDGNGNNIDGDSTYIMYSQYESISIFADGSNWWII